MTYQEKAILGSARGAGTKSNLMDDLASVGRAWHRFVPGELRMVSVPFCEVFMLTEEFDEEDFIASVVGYDDSSQ